MDFLDERERNVIMYAAAGLAFTREWYVGALFSGLVKPTRGYSY